MTTLNRLTTDVSNSKTQEPLTSNDEKDNRQMQAIVQSNYGSPDVLSLQTVERPVLKDNEVLVKVQATSVNAGDWHLMRGTPFLIRLMFGGIFKPAIATLGSDVAGQVEAVGQAVSQFQPGDEVFGEVSSCGFGAFAEYVCATEEALVPKPENITFEEAGAVSVSALAALQGLRAGREIQPGQKVLINGASGGVGSFAVQIAKAFGAEVTAVCSTQKMDMVRSLGADHVVDYTQADVTQQDQQYDLILDTAAYRSVFDYQSVLADQGTYVLIGGETARFFQIMLLGSWISKRMGRKVIALSSSSNKADLTIIRELLESGKIKPFIDKRYRLSEVPDAIRYVEQRQVRGKVSIEV